MVRIPIGLVKLKMLYKTKRNRFIVERIFNFPCQLNFKELYVKAPLEMTNMFNVPWPCFARSLI